MSVGKLTSTVSELIRGSTEREFLEFKTNFLEPEKVGSYISALANSASIADQPFGYVVWGVNDQGQVVGTTADPWKSKGKGNEDLIPWLRHNTHPVTADFEFQMIELEGKPLVVLQIARAVDSPVRFIEREHIRVGPHTKRLHDHPAKERELWKSFDRTPFERRVAIEDLSADDVERHLSFSTYCEFTKQPQSSDRNVMFGYLEADGLIVRDGGDRWSILNLGALCLASQLRDLEMGRKAVRFVAYEGSDRGTVKSSIDGSKGYVVGFKGLLDYIEGSLPRREFTDPIRREVEHFPRISVRELIVNALVHQDLSVAGAGPLIELFTDRLEISSPGAPLHEDPRRLLDSPARSRNERLASFMRKAGLCEERGSGIDRVALAAEEARLPAPEIRIANDNTVAILLGPRTLNQMDQASRLECTYLHAALRHVNHEEVTNSSIRERFDIQDSARASRLLAEAMEAALIKPRDVASSRKHMKYVPYWA